jgi:hypothetical protein
MTNSNIKQGRQKNRNLTNSGISSEHNKWFLLDVLNVTFTHISVISCWSVLLVEAGGHAENHRSVASY